MTRRSWYLVTALAFALHNGEEALGATRMFQVLQTSGPAYVRAFYVGIDPSQLRMNLLALTLIGLVLAVLAARVPSSPTLTYLMLVFVAVIGLNALAHLALALMLGGYMPGLLTAIVVNLPVAALVATQAWRERWVPRWSLGLVVAGALVVHCPLLAAFMRITAA